MLVVFPFWKTTCAMSCCRNQVMRNWKRLLSNKPKPSASNRANERRYRIILCPDWSCETRDVSKHRQVSGAINSAKKYFQGRKEDMRIRSDLKPSFNLPGNTIDGEIPFISDHGKPMGHTPRHNWDFN
jgi:hypothetical protein